MIPGMPFQMLALIETSPDKESSGLGTWSFPLLVHSALDGEAGADLSTCVPAGVR